MGLAEPRKRLKISHDPQNLTWAQSAESYGQKLLASQGWKPGQGLGFHGAKQVSSSVHTAKVIYKDDTLGLGASLTSRYHEHSRTGLDAFQGLLGRLNGKNESEARRLEQNHEDRKLVMWTQGKWGGITFTPGGLLVQGEKYKKAEEQLRLPEISHREVSEIADTRAARKAAKALRKAQREARREAKLKRQAQSNATNTAPGDGTKQLENLRTTESNDQPVFETHKQDQRVQSHAGVCAQLPLSPDEQEVSKERLKKKHRPSSKATKALEEMKVVEAVQLPAPSSEAIKTPVAPTATQPNPTNGRFLLRRRNIESKRMAFTDAKLLDEIFMRAT